jgi:hypothetical protein
MFIRFRENKSRLQVSLVETRRADGKGRHEHIASFGSVEMPQTIAARVEFWRRLHERLSRLANRVPDDMHGRILESVHHRVPVPTLDEQRQLKIETAETNERFWSRHRDHLQGTVVDHEGLAAKTERAIATGKARVAEAATKPRAPRMRPIGCGRVRMYRSRSRSRTKTWRAFCGMPE